MITKEKEELNNTSTEEIKSKDNEQIKLDIEDIKNKYNKYWKLLIWFMITTVIVLSLIVAYILNAFNMVIYNPFETRIITVTSEDKDWYKNENINLFQSVNKNGEKIIWPGQSGKYSFIVKNDTTQPAYYKFYMEDTNEYNINIKYRLKMNNTYIKGDENTWVSINDMNIEDIFATKDSKTLYTLEWKWDTSDRDLEIAKEGLATYTVYIRLRSI